MNGCLLKVYYLNEGYNVCRRGCWPKNVDVENEMSLERFRRKVERRAGYKEALDQMEPLMLKMLKQNTIIDLFEEDFGGVIEEVKMSSPSIENLTGFK